MGSGLVWLSQQLLLLPNVTSDTSDRTVKAVRLFIASDGVPYLRMVSIGLHSTSGRKKVKKERMLTDIKSRPVVHGAMGRGQKSFKLDVAVPLAPLRVPSQRTLAPSVTSVTSVANNNIPGTVHRSPGICLTIEENPGKPQLGDRIFRKGFLRKN